MATLNLKFKPMEPAPQLLRLAQLVQTQAGDVGARLAAADLLADVHTLAQARPCARCSHSVWQVLPTPPMKPVQVHCGRYINPEHWLTEGWCTGGLAPSADGSGFAGDEDAGRAGRVAGTGEVQRPAGRERP